jgi:hypothetical protein
MCSCSSSFSYSPTKYVTIDNVDVVEIQNGEVQNVSNIIIIQMANIKSSVGQQGPPTNARVGSGAMEE